MSGMVALATPDRRLRRNVIFNCIFDLTSEQFGDEKLVYENNPEQFREVHFAKEEKRLRYEYLKERLKQAH